MNFFLMLLFSGSVFSQWDLSFESKASIDAQVIEKATSLINLHCKIKKPITINITFLTQEMLLYAPGEAARTNSTTWIEVNPSTWSSLDETQKLLLLIHEFGHSIGLDHILETTDVMAQNNLNTTVDYGPFWNRVQKKCLANNR